MSSSPEIRFLMTRDEVAELLNVTKQTVDKLRADGVLTWVSVGRNIRIHGASVRKLITPNESDPSEE